MRGSNVDPKSSNFWPGETQNETMIGQLQQLLRWHWHLQRPQLRIELRTSLFLTAMPCDWSAEFEIKLMAMHAPVYKILKTNVSITELSRQLVHCQKTVRFVGGFAIESARSARMMIKSGPKNGENVVQCLNLMEKLVPLSPVFFLSLALPRFSKTGKRCYTFFVSSVLACVFFVLQKS